MPASAIARMLGREGIDADAPAASILGRLAQVTAELEIVEDAPRAGGMATGHGAPQGAEVAPARPTVTEDGATP